MKITLIILLTINSYGSELKKAANYLRDNQFLYVDSLSGENDEIYSIISHAIEKEDKVISTRETAREMIEKDLKTLNKTPAYINSCKNHINSKSLILDNLNKFLSNTNTMIKYEYEFSGKIVTTDKYNILKRNYQCFFAISSIDSDREFKTKYYLRNRDMTEKSCNSFINSLQSTTSGLLIEYKKYHSYRYDTPSSDGVWAYHCAISISK